MSESNAGALILGLSKSRAVREYVTATGDRIHNIKVTECVVPEAAGDYNLSPDVGGDWIRALSLVTMASHLNVLKDGDTKFDDDMEGIYDRLSNMALPDAKKAGELYAVVHGVLRDEFPGRSDDVVSTCAVVAVADQLVSDPNSKFEPHDEKYGVKDVYKRTLVLDNPNDPTRMKFRVEKTKVEVEKAESGSTPKTGGVFDEIGSSMSWNQFINDQALIQRLKLFLRSLKRLLKRENLDYLPMLS